MIQLNIENIQRCPQLCRKSSHENNISCFGMQYISSMTDTIHLYMYSNTIEY